MKRKPVYAGLAIALGLAVSLPLWETRVFHAQFLFQKAIGAKAYAYWDAAYELLRKGERLTPWQSKFPRDMGRIDLNQKRPERAIEQFRRSLELEPHYVLTLAYLADAYFNKAVTEASAQGVDLTAEAFHETLDTAEHYAQKTLEISAYMTEGYDVIGRSSLVRARRLVREHPTEAEQEAAGVRQRLEHWWQRAIENLRQSLLHGAKNPDELYRMMAEAYAGLGEINKAADAYRRSTRANATSKDTWRQFYAFAMEHGRTADMADALRQALRGMEQDADTDPENYAMVVLWLAEIYRHEPQSRDLGRKALLRAMAVTPARLDIWGAYAAFVKGRDQRHRLEEALDLACAKLQEANEDTPPVLKALADLLASGDHALVRGAATMRLACAQRGKEERASVVKLEYNWLADLFFQALAGADVSQAQRAEAYQDVGAVYVTAQNWAMANAAFQHALGLLSGEKRVPALLNQAEVLAHLGDHFKAEALVKEALQIDPENFHAAYRLARTKAMAGWNAAARMEYENLLRSFTLNDQVRQQLEQEMNALGS